MRLLIDTRNKQFTVTKVPEPQVNHDTGVPRTDRQSGEPLFSVQLLVLDDTGGEVIAVTVAGQPKVTIGAPVDVTDLIAIRGSRATAAAWHSGRRQSRPRVLRQPNPSATANTRRAPGPDTNVPGPGTVKELKNHECEQRRQESKRR